MSIDITLLKEEQIWGDKALQAMKSYGTKTGMSDLAILLGGVVGNHHKTGDNQRAGVVWALPCGRSPPSQPYPCLSCQD
jgi:hypothetical protein